jgi:hypothetical protein
MQSRAGAPFIAALLIGSPAVVDVSSGSDVVEARPGAKVRITTVEPLQAVPGQSAAPEGIVVGTLVEGDGGAITVLRQTEKDRIRIPRTAIKRLEIGKGSTRGRNALIGAGIGAGIGLAWATVEHSRCKGEMLCGVEFALPVLTTPVGALVGLATGKQRWVDASPTPVAVSVLPARRGIGLACSVSF